MNRANSILTIVSNVLGPCLAFNVDDDATHWTFKVNSDKWTQIALRVLEREIVAGKALLWIVFDWSNVLHISGILAFA